MVRQQKTAAARESAGETPSLEHPLILSIQAYYALVLAGHFRPSSWNLMRPNLPAQGSSRDAISARARHIIKRQQRSHHNRFQAPQSGLNAPGHRSRGRPFMPAEPKPPIPVAARNQTHTRGQGPISASRLDRLAQPLRRVAFSSHAAGGSMRPHG